MKKKLIFLFIFVVSLFIYCNKVDAVVMWRDCGKVHYIYKDADYKVLHESDQYNLYFVKMEDASEKIGVYAFLTNEDGSIRPGRQINPNAYSWYESESTLPSKGKNGIIDDSIDLESVIDEGICPETVVYYIGTDSPIPFHFDFAGTNRNINIFNSMDNYQLVIYKMKNGDLDTFSTVLETYDSNGSYGLAISGKMGEVVSHLDFASTNVPEEALEKGLVSGGVLGGLVGILEGLDADYIEMTANKQIALAKVAKGNNNYFDITDRNKRLLFGDLAPFIIMRSNFDGHGGAVKHNYFFRLTPDDFSRSYDFSYIYDFNGKNYSTAYDFALTQGIINSPSDKYNGKSINDSDLSLVDESSFRYMTKKSTYIWPEVVTWAEKLENVLGPKQELYQEIFTSKGENQSKDDNKGKYYNVYQSLMEMNKNIDANKSNIFPDNYDYEQLISNMDDMYEICNTLLENGEDLNNVFETWMDDCSNVTYASPKDGDPKVTSLSSTMMCDLFRVPYNKFTTLGGVDVRKTVKSTFKKAMKDQIKLYENEHPDFKVANYTTDIRDLLISIVKVGTYIQDRVSGYTQTENKKLDSIIEKCQKLLRNQYEVELVIDCESLIDEQLMNRLSKYLNIIKIAVPLLLLVFGILDFAKAMFAGDDDKMKKAQKNFIMRVIIAVLFFLSPLIVQLILRIANKAWDFITPNVCNIFSGE